MGFAGAGLRTRLPPIYGYWGCTGRGACLPLPSSRDPNLRSGAAERRADEFLGPSPKEVFFLAVEELKKRKDDASRTMYDVAHVIGYDHPAAD